MFKKRYTQYLQRNLSIISFIQTGDANKDFELWQILREQTKDYFKEYNATLEDINLWFNWYHIYNGDAIARIYESEEDNYTSNPYLCFYD